MTADRRTFVSATSASGSPEVRTQLSFCDVSLSQLRSRASSEIEVQTTLRVIGQIGLVPRDEEPCGQAITRDEDGVLGTEKRRRTIAKVTQRRHPQVVTSVTTVSNAHDSCNMVRQAIGCKPRSDTTPNGPANHCAYGLERRSPALKHWTNVTLLAPQLSH